MSEPTTSSSSSFGRVLIGLLLIAAVIAGAWWIAQERDLWPRSEALETALRPLIDGKNVEQALVSRAIWENYLETRSNASRWSAVYWGLTFTAAVLSALAALVLKLETLIKSEGAKKDLAAMLSIVAALCITIPTSGDFQRKWQANRIAAAEFENIGYEFLQKDGVEARSYLAAVGKILLRRNMAIVGGAEQRNPLP